MIELIQRVMKSLLGEDATLMDLFYHQQLSIEDINIYFISVSNVKVKLHRIRKRIFAAIQLLLKPSTLIM